MSLRSVADITNTIVLFWIAVTLIVYGIFQNAFWQGVAFLIIWLFVSLCTSTVIVKSKNEYDESLK